MQPSHPDTMEDGDQTTTVHTTTPGHSARSVVSLARRAWDPTPIPKPRIIMGLEHMCWAERSAAVVGHALLSLEYWLSQGGWLREWIRLNLWIAVVLIVAAVLLIPPITAVLEGVRDWTELLSATVGNINATVSMLPPIVLALATAFVAVKLILRYRSNRRPQRRQEYHPYE
ncbi:MAG: hypothetical protein ACSHX9_14955 [Luteolibacter sp.]